MLKFLVIVGAFSSAALLFAAIMLIMPENRQKLGKILQILVDG